jgi:transcription elongation factor GreA
MFNQLTENDIAEMEKEIEHRKLVVRPRLLEDVKEARAHGDLSENFEFYAAKREKNRNESRIRYLERMIRTAKVIEVTGAEDTVSLFDKLLIYNEMIKKEMTIQIVTTLRQDALKGLISKESPVGQAVMGHKVGERVQVEVSPAMKYFVEIRGIEKGEDDESLEISSY